MLYIYTEITKYLIILFMALFLAEGILSEVLRDGYEAASGFVIRQRIYMVIIMILAYSTMTLKTGKLDYAFFGLFVMVMLVAVLILTNMLYSYTDNILLNNMAMMINVGMIMLIRLNFNKSLKQLIIAVFSLGLAMFIPMLLSKFQFINDYGYIYALAGILPLLVVLILGVTTNGSKLSFSILGITIQPSELVKIIFVFCISALFSKAKNYVDIVITIVIAAIHVLVLVLSKDLGSALIYFVAYIFMMFIFTHNYLLFGLALVSGAFASFIAYKVFTHVQVRVAAFLDPFSVIDREGYQIGQSLFALGCGNFFGMGLTKGAPNDIPFVESDFIFSAICEEMGALFGILLLGICMLSFVIIMRTSIEAKGKFRRILAAGIGVMYIFQVFLTVGGGIKFIPLTGVTLPFVSYGGSSILSSVIMFFIVEWVIMEAYDE